LCGLSDHRHRRGRRYELAVILMATLLAKLAGQDKPDGIAEWVHLRQTFLIDVLGLKRTRLPQNLFENPVSVLTKSGILMA